jgi:hypothetical protein
MTSAVIVRSPDGICVLPWATLVACLRRDNIDWLVNACNEGSAVAVWPQHGRSEQTLLHSYISGLFAAQRPLFYRCPDQCFFVPDNIKIIAFISIS